MAPTEAPKTRSARMSRRMSSSSMPTWTAPRLPPPARTNAVRSRCGRCAPSERWRRCAQRARTRSVNEGGGAPSKWLASLMALLARRIRRALAAGLLSGSATPVRPAMSWRTAQMMTITTSASIATTKIPKITKKAVLPADASRSAGAMSVSG